MDSKIHDVLILGGGPAGMSAALVAGRARLDAVLLDAGAPRNAVAHASHGFLTRDGVHALELRRLAREQMKPYQSVVLRDGRATSVSQLDGGFEVVEESGKRWVARRLVVATGYRDEVAKLQIPGLLEAYGVSVFPCPFCDGFENGDTRLGVIGSHAGMMGPMLRIWSDDVVAFTNGAPLETKSELERRGVRVYESPIRRVHHRDGKLVSLELEDGETVERDTAFLVEDYSVPATPFAAQLGVGTRTNPWGMEVLDVSETGASDVERLRVIGDARKGFSGLIQAAADGYACMAELVHEIATERWERA